MGVPFRSPFRDVLSGSRLGRSGGRVKAVDRCWRDDEGDDSHLSLHISMESSLVASISGVWALLVSIDLMEQESL